MKIPFFATLCLLLVFTACKKEKNEQNNDSGKDRQKALEDYNSNYLGTDLKYSLWSGNINDCESGLCPQNTNDKVLQRINYFRRMVGLNDNVVWDTAYFKYYQKAALMMKANNMLDHNPPNTWDCWSQEGLLGAKTSNLSLGSHSVNAVTGQIRDAGANNAQVGHRRWILYSKQSKMSYGSTDNTMSLGVFGIPNGQLNTKYPEYIAYPPNGYIPLPLLFTRWSCAVPTANMDAATVEMSGPDGNIPVNIIANGGSYGDAAVVWEPQGLVIPSSGDVEFKVTIKNIINGPQQSVSYTVKVFRP